MFQFIKKVVNWFKGDAVPPVQAAAETSRKVAEAAAQKRTPALSPTEDVYRKIIEDARVGDFLKELQSIPPATKEFEKSKENMVQELKKLKSPKPPQ